MGLPGAALAVQAISSGMSLYDQQRARKEAKKATEEQRKQDAWTQLMAAAGGQGVVRPTPISEAPTVNYGGALAQIGSSLGSFSDKQAASAQAAKELAAKQDQETWLRGYRERVLQSKTPTPEEVRAKQQDRLMQIGNYARGIPEDQEDPYTGIIGTGKTPEPKASALPSQYGKAPGEIDQMTAILRSLAEMSGAKVPDIPGSTKEDKLKYDLYHLGVLRDSMSPADPRRVKLDKRIEQLQSELVEDLTGEGSLLSDFSPYLRK